MALLPNFWPLPALLCSLVWKCHGYFQTGSALLAITSHSYKLSCGVADPCVSFLHVTQHSSPLTGVCNSRQCMSLSREGQTFVLGAFWITGGGWCKARPAHHYGVQTLPSLARATWECHGVTESCLHEMCCSDVSLLSCKRLKFATVNFDRVLKAPFLVQSLLLL